MSRSGYQDEIGSWATIRYRGAVASAIRGKRGQALLRELAAALDAMPVRALITDDFARADGTFCALGVLGSARGMARVAMNDLAEHTCLAAKAFGVAEALVAEIEYENDEGSPWRAGREESPDERWTRVRKWVEGQIT